MLVYENLFTTILITFLIILILYLMCKNITYLSTRSKEESKEKTKEESEEKTKEESKEKTKEESKDNFGDEKGIKVTTKNKINIMDIIICIAAGIMLGVFFYLISLEFKKDDENDNNTDKVDDNLDEKIYFNDFNNIYKSRTDSIPTVYKLIKFSSAGTLDKLNLNTVVNSRDVNKVSAYLKLENSNSPFAQIIILNNGNVENYYEDLNISIEKGDILTLVMIGSENNELEFTKLKIKCILKRK